MYILLRCCNCGLSVINKRICYVMLCHYTVEDSIVVGKKIALYLTKSGGGSVFGKTWTLTSFKSGGLESRSHTDVYANAHRYWIYEPNILLLEKNQYGGRRHRGLKFLVIFRSAMRNLRRNCHACRHCTQNVCYPTFDKIKDVGYRCPHLEHTKAGACRPFLDRFRPQTQTAHATDIFNNQIISNLLTKTCWWST